jgi:hypothetical protein
MELAGFNVFESSGRRQLLVTGDEGDQVNLLDPGWEDKGAAFIQDANYEVWEHDACLATLYLDPEVALIWLITPTPPTFEPV